MSALRNGWTTVLLVALWASVSAGQVRLRGLVTAVRGDVVELSVGSEDGVRRGMVFSTKSHTGQVVRCEVTAVSAHRATARIVQNGDAVKVGDPVELEEEMFPLRGQPLVTPVPITSVSEPVLPAEPVPHRTTPVMRSSVPVQPQALLADAHTAVPIHPLAVGVAQQGAGRATSALTAEWLALGNLWSRLTSFLPGTLTLQPPPHDAPERKKADTVSVTERLMRWERAVVLVEVTTPNALHWTTGVVVSPDGYIVTCDEYIAFSSTVHIYLANSKRYPAKVIEKDPRGRLALLKLGVLAPDLVAVELQEASGIEPGTRAMALGYHFPPLMVLRELPFRASTAWGTLGDLHMRRDKGSRLEADMEPDIGFLGAPVFRMDTGQFAGVIVSIRSRSEDNARQAGLLTVHRTLTMLTPVDAVREFLEANRVQSLSSDPSDTETLLPPTLLLPGDMLNLRLLPSTRELPALFHQRYRLGLGSSYREDVVSDACHRFLGRVPAAVSEPLWDRDTLFFGSINGRFYAFDPLRGEAETFWANEGIAFLYAPVANREVVCASAGAVNLSPRARKTLFRQLAAMAARVVTGNIIAPQVEKVVPDISDMGLLYGWDRATGNIKWVYRTRFLGPSKMVGERVYFAGLGVLGALDVETGEEIWVLSDGTDPKKDKGLVWYHIGHGDEQNLYVTAIPVELCLEEQYQVCAAGAGEAQLQCLDPHTGKVKWQQKMTTLEAAHTALSAEIVYQPEDQTLWSLIGPHIITADLRSGKKIRGYKKELQGSAKSSPPLGMAYGSGILYLISDQNLLYAVNAETGADIWAKPFPARGRMGTPVVSKNRVYVGSADGFLYSIDAARGTLVWKAKTGGTLLSRPVVQGDTVYCISDEGDVHVIHVPHIVDYQPVESLPTVQLRRSGLELGK